MRNITNNDNNVNNNDIENYQEQHQHNEVELTDQIRIRQIS